MVVLSWEKVEALGEPSWMTVTTCRAQLDDALEGYLVPDPSLTLSSLPGSFSPSHPLLHDNLPELIMHVVNAARQPWTDFSEIMS